MHLFLSSDGKLIVELPRFGLSFYLEYQGAERVMSSDFEGFSLDCEQVFGDTLLGFSKYLVISNEVTKENKVIIPEGNIKYLQGRHGIDVTVSAACDAVIEYCVYDVHQRFRYLSASCVSARLMLAALYAATSTFLPDARCSMCGDEYAMHLLRQSWKNQPFDKKEMKYLMTVKRFCFKTPALYILCKYLLQSSKSLCFCYFLEKDESNDGKDHVFYSDIMTAYEGTFSYRKLLQPLVEATMLEVHGRVRSEFPSSHTYPNMSNGSLHTSTDFTNLSDQLSQCVTTQKPSMEQDEFPLDKALLSKTSLGREMYEALKESWTKYFQFPKYKASSSCLDALEDIMLKTSLARESLEELLLTECFSCITSFHDSKLLTFKKKSVLIFKLRRILGQYPMLSIRDLMLCAYDAAVLKMFNPFLSDESCHALRMGILNWLQLCVLEDKAARLIHFRKTGQHAKLTAELLVTREWSPSEHPKWLVFEVESQIQIRPVQYLIVQTLLTNPGAIAQLNMGEGKTRVILPMLILHYSESKKVVLRLFILSQLIDEGYDFLHRYLTATILEVKLFRMPFCRDVQLNNENVQMLQRTMQLCRRAGGALVVAPEHVLSMQLMNDEYRMFSSCDEQLVAVQAQLNSLLDVPVVDVLDEADEILRHKYQLIYTVGSRFSLESGYRRWHAAYIILQALHSPSIKEFLDEHPAAFVESPPRSTLNCAYQPIRFVTGPEFQKLAANLNLKIASFVVENPTYHTRWLKSPHSKRFRDDFIQYLTSKMLDDSLEEVIARSLHDNEMEDLLSFRGLLAGGIAAHCLQRRHSVNYGVTRPHPMGKRMAVPFEASDPPRLRSEFGHPDVAIFYTLLSYFEDGLSETETKEAVSVLLGMDPTAQRYVYNLWLEMSSRDMKSDDLVKLYSVDKLDLGNEEQAEMLWKYYAHNPETIFFWLNHVVFPVETTQYEHRMVKTPWHLCERRSNDSDIFGFSGTVDNSKLMPLHVREKITESDYLQSTNGKMISMIQYSASFVPVPLYSEKDKTSELPLWQRVLNLAMSPEVCSSALIDSGAVLAGINLSDAANYVLSHWNARDNELSGVVYFDAKKKLWIVVTSKGQIWPLHTSPIREHECFVMSVDAEERI